jgi:hypothetical protein
MMHGVGTVECSAIDDGGGALQEDIGQGPQTAFRDGLTSFQVRAGYALKSCQVPERLCTRDLLPVEDKLLVAPAPKQTACLIDVFNKLA